MNNLIKTKNQPTHEKTIYFHYVILGISHFPS